MRRITIIAPPVPLESVGFLTWLNANAAAIGMIASLLSAIAFAIWHIATKYSAIQTTLGDMRDNVDEKFTSIEDSMNENFLRLEKNLTARMDESSDEISSINRQLISNIREIAVLEAKYETRNERDLLSRESRLERIERSRNDD